MQKGLCNTLTHLKRKPELLKQYDNIFKEQLKTGIIEEVNEEGVSHWGIALHSSPSRNQKQQINNKSQNCL